MESVSGLVMFVSWVNKELLDGILSVICLLP